MYCLDNGNEVVFSKDYDKLVSIRAERPQMFKRRRIKHVIQMHPSYIIDGRIYDRHAIAAPNALKYKPRWS